jgi:hypothetical protein
VLLGAVGFRFPNTAVVKILHEYGAHAAVSPESTSTFTLLCLWNLWKHMNTIVLREQQPCLPLVFGELGSLAIKTLPRQHGLAADREHHLTFSFKQYMYHKKKF